MSDSGPRALFVCRGSREEGLGHVIRTRTVVEACRPHIEAELLVVGDELPSGLLSDLERPWRSFSSEAELRSQVFPGDWQATIFDQLTVEPETFSLLGSGRVTASLSPIFNRDDVDMTFNRTRYAHPSDGCAVQHHGLEYAVVRPACSPISTPTYVGNLDDGPPSLAICMGGADASNRTLEVIDALRPLEAAATFWVILGEGYGHSYRQLVERVRSDTAHEIILAKTNRSMWRIMGNCTLAVLAGGVTSYEAARAGLPSVNVLANPHREFLIRELVEHEVATSSGFFSEGYAKDVFRAVSDLLSQPERLLAMHRASRDLIDGRGPERIVARIREAIVS